MFSWLQGPLFTVVCCVISFSYKASRSNKSKGVCYFPCLMYVHLTLLTLNLGLSGNTVYCLWRLENPPTSNNLLPLPGKSVASTLLPCTTRCQFFKLFLLSGFQIICIICFSSFETAVKVQTF